MPTSPLQLGQLFATFQDLKTAIEDWAITDKFEFRVHAKVSDRGDYRCKILNCPWRVYGSRTRAGDIKLSRLIEEHNCIGAAAVISSAIYNSQAWLCRTVPKHLIVTKRTKAHEVIDTIRLHHRVEVNYAAAYHALCTLANTAIDHERAVYEKLPAYVQRLRQENPGVYAHLEIVPHLDPETNLPIPRFNRIFISPAEVRFSFEHCRKFVAMDGTFCKARFVQTLLAAVTIDANGHILLLAWAIVESENENSWTSFMNHLKQAILAVMRSTIISNRSKGLMAAEEVLEPRISRAYCCFHLCYNFKTRFGTRLTEKYFSKIANANTEQ